jgi:hypothetical protein
VALRLEYSTTTSGLWAPIRAAICCTLADALVGSSNPPFTRDPNTPLPHTAPARASTSPAASTSHRALITVELHRASIVAS